MRERDEYLLINDLIDSLSPFPVAIQCLETAFGVSMEDQSLAVSQTLPEIFEAVAGKVRECPEMFSLFFFLFP